MSDKTQDFAERIRAASGPLRIRGGGTKDFYGESHRGEVLDTRAHRGVVAYEPSELVVTVRSGTPLVELEALLAEKNQMLAFEPPHFGRPAAADMSEGQPIAADGGDGAGGAVGAVGAVGAIGADAADAADVATIGGAVAAGLSGPRRAAAGAVRDYVLGVKLLDGQARELRFGGQVMKNVAGYDVSRLLAGSLGTLGLMLEVSLKVLPRPAAEASVRLDLPHAAALATMNQWAGRPLPISATAWRDDALTVRLSGAHAAVSAALAKLGGEVLADDVAAQFWRDLRDQRLDFFAGDEALWRLSLPSTAVAIDLPGDMLIEWGGSQRWLHTGAAAADVRAIATRLGGHATLFRGGDKADGAFQPLAPALAGLNDRVRRALDPQGVFDTGRL